MEKLFCLFFVLFPMFSSCELVNSKISILNPDELVHQRIVHGIKREILQSRQQSCQTILNNYPTECNVSLLAGNITNLVINDPSKLTSDDFTKLNNAFSQVCVAKCVNPILKYYRCLDISDDLENYLTNLVQRGICGKQGNDFCEVLYLRRYSTNIHFVNRLVNACPFTSSGVDCSSAGSTCKGYVSNFNSNMECCTLPYLGDVSSCNVNVVSQCESAISGSIIVAPAIVCLFLAALLTMFF